MLLTATASNVDVTLQTILAWAGAVTIIITAITNLSKLFAPYKKLQEKVNDHEDRLKDGDDKFDEFEKYLNHNSDMTKEICKSLIVIMNHEITGNGIDKLKAQQEQLQNFLIDKDK